MNVLMLGWELPPHNSGGLGVACYHMSKALAQNGAKIDFVVPFRHKHSDINFMDVHNATNLLPQEKFGLGVYDSKYVTEKTFPETDSQEAANIRNVQKKYIKFVENLVISSKPDIIHVHDWLTMEAGMRAKELSNVPLIVHVHATEFDRCGSKRGNPLVHEIEYNGLVMADKIIAVSNITKDIIVKNYGIPSYKIDVIHNAIDMTDFNDGYEYDAHTYKYLEALKSEGYTIVSNVTRFTIQKGLPNLIRAFSKACQRYDKLALLLVGDGEMRDELIKLTADLNVSDKIFFTGFVRGKQWRDAYGVSDTFVMSSISEPFGLTALEAAFHGNAIILTRQSGVGEVLSSVLRYDFWDEDRLADQIVGIATTPALKESLQENIRHEYARISWHDVAQKFMDIYHKMTQAVIL